MDPIALAGMIFSLIVIVLIGGAIITYPIFSRLGKALEVYLEERRRGGAPAAELDGLEKAIATLDARLEALEERQGFVEKLVDERSGRSLPGQGRGDDA